MLDELRQEIDACDAIITQALCRRFKTVTSVAAHKKANGQLVNQPDRENVILHKVANKLEDNTYSGEIQQLYKYLLKISRRVQMKQIFPYNIVLIGFMGSGKSTIGSYLSESSGYTFKDVDKEIEQETGREIQEIFRHEGEEYFRKREREIIKQLAGNEHAIIACGGGAVLDEENVSVLRETGKLVWLKAAPATIYSRVREHNNRPLLQNKNCEDIQKMLETREVLYNAAADYEIITDNRTVDQIGDEILHILIGIEN